MFLKKVHVKNFPGLKDVVLEFNQSLSPSVFPVGSLNGGGKSTLLQLIFILLRCASDPEKHHYIQNIFKSNLSNFDKKENEVIYFVINYQGDDVEIQFLAASHQLADQDLREFYLYEQVKKTLHEHFRFNFTLDDLQKKINDIHKNYIILSEIIRSLKQLNLQHKLSPGLAGKPEQYMQSIQVVESLLRDFQIFLNQYQWPNRFFNLAMIKLSNIRQLTSTNIPLITENLDGLLSELDAVKAELDDSLKILTQSEKRLIKIKALLKRTNYHYITILSEDHLLFCKTSSDISILDVTAQRVFWACPLMQVFIFIREEDRLQLLDAGENLVSYMKSVDAAKKAIGNWYTYEFAPAKTLTEIFKRCIDEDTKIALQSGGEYGNSLKKMQEEVNHFFNDKNVFVEKNLQSIFFKKKDTDTQFLPEDLSHGELKKFGIYLWLKYMEIKDAIVMMDEVEIGFHPDWQYEIIHELLKWSNNNQFILATHSYDLCSAVTPAHVNEIEPRLISERKNDQTLE